MKSIAYTLIETIKKLPKKNKIEIFSAGAMLGLISSWIYLLSGGSTGWFVPLWALKVFLPGFLVGTYCYNLSRNMPLALLFGSLSVGMFYGIVLVVMQCIWNLLTRRKKYIIVVLCIITVVTGMLFLNYLYSSSDSKSLSREFTLSITSDPSGAKVYPLNYGDQPDSIGTTPLELKGSYSIDLDGSGWGISGQGINFKSTEEGILVLLNCVVIKDGYTCQELAPVLATVPPNITRPDQIPLEFKYNAKLIPNESPYVKHVGKAVLVNGAFLGISPPSLKMNEGIYIIDIQKCRTGN
jgi:hypothetical protein